MRNDIDGMFWNDVPPPKPPPKTKPKRNPPPRTWESPDYLPNLAEALAFDVEQYTDAELVAASNEWFSKGAKHRMVFDIECYPNYFLIVFQSIQNGKITYLEMTEGKPLDTVKLAWMMTSFCLVSFNGIGYDVPIASLAMAGKSNHQIQWATDEIIARNERPYVVLRKMKVKKVKADHIDLIEVAPLRASLKIYAGRLHCKRMQDLPFKPGTVLSPNQMAIVRWYCVNDCSNTTLLYKHLEEQVQLRETLSLEYGVDLRSHSDAQISEAVIAHEVAKMNGAQSRKPEILPGTVFNYQVPAFLNYETPNLKWLLEQVRNVGFVVQEDGYVNKPENLEDLDIPIGDKVYRFGIGGLHSKEKKQTILAGEDAALMDIDVASNYPKIILNQGLFPKHLGINFIHVYRRIVERRLHAKDAAKQSKNAAERLGDLLKEVIAECEKITLEAQIKGHKEEARKWLVIADCLKIVVNGGFGKFGSPHSILYSPHLLLQVTLTGQLALMLLIERFTLAGIPVVSANTDGIVIRCLHSRQTDARAIIKQWERDTDFETEETRYRGIFSRDVNNYFAVKTNGEVKVKGAYAEKGSAGNSVLSKNPTNLICADAVKTFLTTGAPISKTIRECRDIRRFVSVRKVKGGAVKDDKYLGESIRLYYAVGVTGEIIYALNGNKVPRSDNAKPLMDLPDIFPEDVDYSWYEGEAFKILQEIGYEKAL